jgi:hypothetical protein
MFRFEPGPTRFKLLNNLQSETREILNKIEIKIISYLALLKKQEVTNVEFGQVDKNISSSACFEL